MRDVVEQYSFIPARIMDDLILCEARAWYAIHGSIGARVIRLFDSDTVRERVVAKTLAERLRSRGFNVLIEPQYMVLAYGYSFGFTGKPDLVVETGRSSIVIELTLTPASKTWYIGCRLALYALMYKSLYGITPLSLIISTHDLSIAVYNDYSGYRLRKLLWLINNLYRKNIQMVKSTHDKNLCRVCRFKRICIYARG